MKLIDDDGKEWDVVGFQYPQEGEHFMNSPFKSVVLAVFAFTKNRMWVVREPEVLHTFGGVTFKETGEVRFPRDGEWFFSDQIGVPVAHTFGAGLEHKILVPV